MGHWRRSAELATARCRTAVRYAVRRMTAFYGCSPVPFDVQIDPCYEYRMPEHLRSAAGLQNTHIIRHASYSRDNGRNLVTFYDSPQPYSLDDAADHEVTHGLHIAANRSAMSAKAAASRSAERVIAGERSAHTVSEHFSQLTTLVMGMELVAYALERCRDVSRGQARPRLMRTVTLDPDTGGCTLDNLANPDWLDTRTIQPDVKNIALITKQAYLCAEGCAEHIFIDQSAEPKARVSLKGDLLVVTLEYRQASMQRARETCRKWFYSDISSLIEEVKQRNLQHVDFADDACARLA